MSFDGKNAIQSNSFKLWAENLQQHQQRHPKKKKTKKSQVELSDLKSKNNVQKLVISRLKKVEETTEEKLKKTNLEEEDKKKTVKSLKTEIQQLQKEINWKDHEIENMRNKHKVMAKRSKCSK